MDFLIRDLPVYAESYGTLLLLLSMLWLIGGAFGLPLPEDIPLLIMGYLAFCHVLPCWAMIMIGLTLVLLGDWLVYWLGRRYGLHVAQIWPFRIFLSPSRLQKASEAFHAHGGKTLFTARFLPGLRTPVFFSAGLFKVPFWKMMAYDGAAALISVPTIIMAAYFFGSHLEKVKHWTQRAQLSIMLVLVGLFALMIAWKLLRKKAAPDLNPVTNSPPPPLSKLADRLES